MNADKIFQVSVSFKSGWSGAVLVVSLAYGKRINVDKTFGQCLFSFMVMSRGRVVFPINKLVTFS